MGQSPFIHSLSSLRDPTIIIEQMSSDPLNGPKACILHPTPFDGHRYLPSLYHCPLPRDWAIRAFQEMLSPYIALTQRYKVKRSQTRQPTKMSRDAEGSLAAFTLLPQPFRTTSLPDITANPIPHATADSGTLTIHTTITSIGASTEPEAITGTESWSDNGGQSVYTDVRTTGTPRVAGLSAELIMDRVRTPYRSVPFT